MWAGNNCEPNEDLHYQDQQDHVVSPIHLAKQKLMLGVSHSFAPGETPETRCEVNISEVVAT